MFRPYLGPHQYSVNQESDVQSYIIIYPSGEFYMSRFVASDQFRQLSLLWRRHKVKAGLHCTHDAQNKAETRVCSYLAPCKNYMFKDNSLNCLQNA